MNNAAIGIFDSGLGGLTVAREITEALPNESLIYVGDQARCPYGPRDSFEVQNFVQQIAAFLAAQEVKIIVIACNTATSCGLDVARQHFNLPIIGVINAGARAAVEATQTNTVAVIGTQRTIESAAYPKAIHELNAQVKVIGKATPELTNIVELGLEKEVAECVQKRGDYYHLVESYLRPLLKHEPDTLLLGCTHYPVLIDALQAVAGERIKIICTANEVSTEVKQFLTNNEQLADACPNSDNDNKPKHIFYTTGNDTENFARLGSRIFGAELEEVRHLSIEELTA